MRRPRSFLCAFVIVGSLVRAVASHAQPAPSSGASAAPAAATDDADRLFREANELYKQKKFAEAEAAYERAFAKKPAHDIAANLGYAEMNQNKLVEAAAHLAYAVRIWPPTGKDDKRQGAMDRLAKVKAEVATLTIDVSVSGAHVFVGDRDVGTSPLVGEVFAEPGKIVVRAKREGYVDGERSIDVAKGSTQAVTLAMTAIPASAPSVTATASTAPTVEAPQRSVVPAYVIGGVGVASLIAGGVLLGLAEATKADVRAQMPLDATGAPRCAKPGNAGATNALCDDLRSNAAFGNTLGNASIVLFAVGAAAVLGGGGYALWATRRGGTSSQAITATPVVGVGSGGLVVTGAF